MKTLSGLVRMVSISVVAALMALAASAPAMEVALSGLDAPGGWTMKPMDGAEGSAAVDASVRRHGDGSIRLTKTNGVGYVRLRSVEPIAVKKGQKHIFRGWFHSEDAPVSSLLLFRFSTEADPAALGYRADDRSAGLMSQSYVVNSRPGLWHKRVLHYVPRQDEEVYLFVVLWGNPCSMWLDDLTFTTERLKRPLPPHIELDYLYSQAEVEKVLDGREPAQAEIKEIDGRSRLLLNGAPATPMVYKISNALLRERGEFALFGDQGVPFTIIPLALGSRRGEGGVWKGKGEYDFSAIDAQLMEVLRKAPESYLIVDLGVSGTYPGWGDEHSDQVWSNAAGELAYTKNGVHFGGFGDMPKNAVRWASYSSPQWRQDTGELVAKCVEYINGKSLGKAVVGYFIGGGHDGQFGIPRRDHSAPSQQAFRRWLTDRYGDVATLNKAWGADYESFDEIKVPELPKGGGMERETAFLALGVETDYKLFQMESVWELKDYFSGVCKKASPRPVITLTYGSMGDYQFLGLRNARYLDVAGTMSYYPFRMAGYPVSWKPEAMMNRDGKMLFQEVDLRSYLVSYGDEVLSMNLTTSVSADEWPEIHRKLLGLSLATRSGTWYYSMARYFAAPEIMGDIGAVVGIQKRLDATPAREFRPDVCLVRTDYSQRFVAARFSVEAMMGTAGSLPVRELETSGVPYDIQYLQDILARPELQTYKVYVFLNNFFVTNDQRAAIRERLCGGGRTLVWVHASGYISEDGKSAEAQSALVGIGVKTEETHERRTALVAPGSHPLAEGLPPFHGAAEQHITAMRTRGMTSFTARPQPFWIDDDAASVFARYRETDQAAMAVKEMDGWTSIYLAPAYSLGGDLLNAIARRAGAYVCGAPGQSIVMNGNFVQIHGTRTGEYVFTPPPGVTAVVDPATNWRQSDNGEPCRLWIEARKTYWFFLE